MRWLRQYDHYSCGPVALINLDKWRGKSVTKRDLPRYRRRCHCYYPDGTSTINFLRTVGQPPISQLNYYCFKEHLLSGGVAIIHTTFDNECGHFFFVRGVAQHKNGRRGFLVVNFAENETLTLLSWQRMARLVWRGYTWLFCDKNFCGL